jgi:hypothetical protein
VVQESAVAAIALPAQSMTQPQLRGKRLEYPHCKDSHGIEQVKANAKWLGRHLTSSLAEEINGFSAKAGRTRSLRCSTSPNHESGKWRRALPQSLSGDTLRAMKAILAEPEIVTRKGKPVSVIIPIKDYEELLERVEDAEDVAWLKRARKKPLHYRPLEDYLAERKRK